MRQSIRRLVQYAGFIITVVLLFNGTTHPPLESEDSSSTVTIASASLLDIEEPDPSTKAAVAENYGKLPLSFEANSGHVDGAVKFLSRGNGYTLFLTSDELVLSLKHGSDRKDEADALRKNPQTDGSKQSKNEVIRLKNIGANPNPTITGLEELPGKSNYFIGNDPDSWHIDVSNYAKVRVEDAYPGINLVYYGNQRQLEYDWVVAPGADPNAIRFAIDSKADLKTDSQGNLILNDSGELRLNKPLIYQERDGDRIEIAGQYVVLDNREVGIKINKYDTSLPLVIDPVLSYSSYIGGSGDDGAYGIAVNSSGNTYVTGYTRSVNFPTENPFQANNDYGRCLVFVTKMSISGDALVYSTYIGGSGRENYGFGIAVDSSGNAYVTGETSSDSFPMENPFQASHGGSRDAFVTKLNTSGNALVYSTYLGGSWEDRGFGIAVDSSGNAYVTGDTGSTDFPTANPFQGSMAGEQPGDAFVTKLNPAGNALIYSTYLGGDGSDRGRGIVVDSSGNAYVAGETMSANFPMANSFQAIFGGGRDVFVTKLNPAGNALIYSTYLGGGGGDRGIGIAVDSSGNAYVAGETYSVSFPTANPFQASYSVIPDAFVTKLNPAGNALVYSTFLGGNGPDSGYGIAVDTSGNAYVTGETESTDFPTANPFQTSYGGGFSDAFVTMLNPAGNALVFSTYFGGEIQDYGLGIAVDSSGNAYIAGSTASSDFPTANPFQASYSGSDDAFVAKIVVPSVIFFPEIAVGGGWSTTFELINTGDTTTSGNLYLNDQQGSNLYVSSSLGTSSWFPISIVPGGSMFLTIAPQNPADPAKHGWARAEFWGGTLSGVATYQFESEGIVTALAGVLPAQPMQFATIPVDDNVNEERTTAYAVANPGDTNLGIKICLVDTEGNVVDDSVSIQLHQEQQIAKYFFQDFDFEEFKGSIVLRAQGGGRFLAVALIQNQDLFTVTPVEPSKAPNIPD